MTRFFFLLAALPYFAGSAAAHPAILPDSSVVVRPDTAASDRTVYLRVDEPPRFQGGDVLAFRDWVFRHLCFGGEMFREGVEARLIVSFVVGRQGAVEEPEVVSSTDERCSAEVLRVLASAPRWTPGRLGDVAVRTKLVMPVNIQLAVPTAADSLAAGWNSVGGGCSRGTGTDAAISGRGSAKFPQMGDGEPEISPGGARG